VIKTSVGNKYISLGLVFNTPGPDEILAADEIEGDIPEEALAYSVTSPLIQLQVLNEDMETEKSVFLTPDEVKRLMVNMLGVSKSAAESAALVDRHFDGYREMVRKESKK
jgi:hypothetical protein